MGNLRGYFPSFMPCGMNVFDIEGIIPLVLSLVRRASSGHLVFFFFFLQGESIGCPLDIFFMLPPSQKEHQVATQDFFCVLNGFPTHFLSFFLMGRKPRFFPRIVFCQKSIG